MWLSFHAGDGTAQRVEATGDRFVIGREETAQLVLDDEKVSRHHASVQCLPDGRAILTDLGSTNGTFVDGKRIDKPTPLNGGERVKIGETVIEVSVAEPSGTPTTPGPAPAAPTELSKRPPPIPPVSAPVPAPPPAARPAAAGARVDSAPAATPSRIERIQLKQSLRRTQILAVVVGVLAVAGLAFGILFATGVFDSGSSQASLPEIIDSSKPAVVQIRGSAKKGAVTAGDGTGWVYDAEKGLIVTNAHVTRAYPFLTVVSSDGKEQNASIVGVADCEDLAVLKVGNTASLETMKLGSQADLKQGEEVVALGYPTTLSKGDPLVATEGVVSVVKTESTPVGELVAYPNVIQMDAPINPGNSGGPLLGLDEDLLGVNTFGGGSTQNQNFAIGVDRVKEIVPGLADGKSVGFAGIDWEIPSQKDLDDAGLPGGIVITTVIPGTPAAAALESTTGEQGVPVDSLLYAIEDAAGNTTKLDNTSESYCRAVGKLRQGDTAAFAVYPLDGSAPDGLVYTLTFGKTPTSSTETSTTDTSTTSTDGSTDSE